MICSEDIVQEVEDRLGPNYSGFGHSGIDALLITKHLRKGEGNGEYSGSRVGSKLILILGNMVAIDWKFIVGKNINESMKMLLRMTAINIDSHTELKLIVYEVQRFDE